LTVNTAKRIDLIQLASKLRHTAIVWRPLRKRDELAGVFFDDEAEPAAVSDGKCLPPLSLARPSQ
jgi:hypothetical protein